MKIALPCPGLEHIQRGFETYTRELFEALKGRTDVHLIKSSGRKEPHAHVIPAWHRNIPLPPFIPARWRTEYRRYQLECWTFAFGMIPLLHREKFDVIHFSEGPLGAALKWLRPRFGFTYRLLFSNGAPEAPRDCARWDAVHQVSPAHDAAGKKFGLPESRSFLVPYGTNGARLRPPANEDRAAVRRHFGLPAEAFVVLSLAALNLHHKRIDWLIREFYRLNVESGFLVLAGNREPETGQLEKLAASLLPREKYRFLQLPYAEVPPLLRASDVTVQCSLSEGFGRVYTEAMGAGVPILAHPHLTARWIIDNEDCLVDMTEEDRLADKLRELSRNPLRARTMVERNLASFRRFEWNALVPEYLEMYQRTQALELRSDIHV